jgi:hypothetical protein
VPECTKLLKHSQAQRSPLDHEAAYGEGDNAEYRQGYALHQRPGTLCVPGKDNADYHMVPSAKLDRELLAFVGNDGYLLIDLIEFLIFANSRYE